MRPLFGSLAVALLIVELTTMVSTFVLPNPAYRSYFSRLAAVDLDPEPEGGEELNAGTSMPGTRMKNMGEAKDVKGDGPAYNFWMQAEVEGALVKEIRTQILKDASRKANFPGFRKGQIPPYAQPQITLFSVQEAVIKTVEGVMDAFELKTLSGSDGEVNVNEDVEAISKGYKVGDNIQFTASIKAMFDQEKQDKSDGEGSDAIIDAEVTADE